MTYIYLIRHAESQPSSDIPQADWPLSERGTEQARQLVRPLSSLGISRIYSSPYPRAVATIEPFATASRISITRLDGLKERTLTSLRPFDWQTALRQSWDDFQLEFPGGESSRSAQARVAGAMTSLAQQGAGRPVAAVSHGNAIALFLHSIDPTVNYDFWAAIKNPDVFKIATGPDRFSWDRSWSMPLE